MTLRGFLPASAGLALALAAVVLTGQSAAPPSESLLRLRNLGKAFYENPTTQAQAVDQFKRALDLAPKSAPDRLNYGLALLRAGRAAEGIAELESVQKMDPRLPHTWFNLGIEYKKLGDTAKAIRQLERMVSLVPNEPIAHYNLGVLFKAEGNQDAANARFELAARLDPNFAAPHFQLFNFYRQSGGQERARAALARFQDLKRRHEESGSGNEDVEWSSYSEVYDPVDPALAASPAQPAALQFTNAALPGKFTPANTTLHVIDLDGSGSSDLLAVSTAGIAVFRKGLTPVPQPAFDSLTGILAAIPGDYDNDGLADLCVLTASGPILFHNTRTGFQRSPISVPAGRYETAVWLDYDHDYDLDLLLLAAKPTLLRNQLPQGFTERNTDIPFVTGKPTSATVTRVVPDTKSHDLIITYADRPAVLYKDRLSGKYEPIALPAVPAGATAVTSADINNDSFPDLIWNSGAAVNKDGAFSAIPWQPRGSFALADLENRGLLDVLASGWVYRNESQGRFTARQNATGLPPNTTVLAAADFDADGRTDLALLLSDGTLHRCLNRTPLRSNWSRVRLTGVKNLKLAPGAEVEVKAGALYQKLLYRGVPLTFGLRSGGKIDTIRITWPNGLIQNETRPRPNLPLAYQEAPRLSGSCPIIWTWNGAAFEYITDVLGVAPLGASSGDGSYFPVDHDEYVSIRGGQLKQRDGRYEVRITEELAEVTYLDQVHLIAVDHPAGREILSNDKWKSPPFPDFRLYGVSRPIPPVRATEDGARDVTARLLHLDRQYPDGFRRDMQGVAATHTLELDFGSAAPSNDAILVLHGWVDWADGSTFLQQAQATPGGLLTPQLQVKDGAGKWVTVIEDMGMPAGKPKTIAVDLTRKFLSASRQVRIVTNLCIYWDRIYLSQDASTPQVNLTELSPAGAGLQFRGFSRNLVHPRRRQPEQFFYEQVSATSMWDPTPGNYTRYGEVTPLLDKVDDKLVIMGSGDELSLHFDAAALPPLPAGWRRDWLLKVDGWAKDRDSNTAFSQTVEPLPFHGMTSYPYPSGQHYPGAAELQQYRERYNTRPALRLLRALHQSGTNSKGVR
ncbi:MAG: VCBS repeat-containing protein [Candidatus Solibacter usitatus]|nr:VCBS repeat-containing protein [Candidatus Solibacter usitatus]